MLKDLFSLLTIIALLFSSCSKSDEEENGDEPQPTKQTAYFGVNLSGAEFGNVYPGVDGTHYGYPTEKDLDYFKAKGLYLVRFPFRWERIQPTMNGELNATELAKMKKFVKAAEDRNIQILLDMHNFGRYCVYCDGQSSQNNQYAIIGNARCTVDNFCDVWKKLAKEFKDYKNIWGYDIMNEPYEMLASTPWVNIAQACINAIRTIDTKTTIIVSGDEFSSARRWKECSDNLKTLTDPSNNLIFQAHIYFDSDSSGNYNKGYDEDGATVQTGVARLKPFVDKNFDLSVFAMARYGQTINSDLLGYYTAEQSVTKNQLAGVDYWTEDNQGAYFPRPGTGDEQKTVYPSLRVRDGSFIKIKNITLGYTLPVNISRKVLMEKCRIYATAYNPFIFVKDKQLKDTDPETNGSDAFPTYRQFVFGVNLTF